MNDVEGVSPSDVVSQLQRTGTKEDLEHAFAQAWRARWDRHRDVPPSRWNTILDFARKFLPRHQMSWECLSPQCLDQMIQSKQAKSACGLDGVSISDLKRMPGSVLSNFCDMFLEAETSGVWPPQLLMGKVVCLAKVEQPRDVMDYRRLPYWVCCIAFGGHTMPDVQSVLLTHISLTRCMGAVLPGMQAKSGASCCGLLRKRLQVGFPCRA